MRTIRKTTEETKRAILNSARECFLEYGYQDASMRKIAVRAGITPGAIYKHFANKEELFGEIFADCAAQLTELTESMMGVDFSAMDDDELRQVFYSEVSVRTFRLLEGDMRLFHMLLKNDSGGYRERFQKSYIKQGVVFADNYYSELYRRGITQRTLSPETMRLLSVAQFSLICEMIADDSCRDGIPPEMMEAFLSAMRVLQQGLEAELGLKRQGENEHGKDQD